MNRTSEAIGIKRQIDSQESQRLRTTIGLKTTTKNKLDKNRAPGQCYDGFICQLVVLWEKTNGK